MVFPWFFWLALPFVLLIIKSSFLEKSIVSFGVLLWAIFLGSLSALTIKLFPIISKNLNILDEKGWAYFIVFFGVECLITSFVFFVIWLIVRIIRA